MIQLSVDTETSGLDLRHIARPFLVTLCRNNEQPIYYEWSVNPHSREVAVDPNDLDEIISYLDEADEIIGQNIKFDIKTPSSLLT
jgi:hypothetical protein